MLTEQRLEFDRMSRPAGESKKPLLKLFHATVILVSLNLVTTKIMNKFKDGKVEELEGRIVSEIIKRVFRAPKLLWAWASQFSRVYFLAPDFSNWKDNDVSRATDHKYNHSGAVHVFLRSLGKLYVCYEDFNWSNSTGLLLQHIFFRFDTGIQ